MSGKRITLAVITVVAAVAAGGASNLPAFAAPSTDGGGAPERVASTPSDDARSAALDVLTYVSATPRPTLPSPSASNADWVEPVAEMVAFYRGFPIESGLAQWDCWLVGASAEVELIPESASSPVTYGYSYAFGCGDGYRPTYDEVLTPRLDALDDDRDVPPSNGS